MLNKHKKNLEYDLKDKSHLIKLQQQLKTTDIVIDPFRPGVLEKLGLGPKNLFEINPRIIMLRVSGYGQKGPMSLRPGHDLNYLAVGGIL